MDYRRELRCNSTDLKEIRQGAPLAGKKARVPEATKGRALSGLVVRVHTYLGTRPPKGKVRQGNARLGKARQDKGEERRRGPKLALASDGQVCLCSRPGRVSYGIEVHGRMM